jgi:hypothetical protein
MGKHLSWHRIAGGFTNADSRFRILWRKAYPAGFYVITDRGEFLGTRAMLRNAQALCERKAESEFRAQREVSP